MKNKAKKCTDKLDINYNSILGDISSVIDADRNDCASAMNGIVWIWFFSIVVCDV